MTAAISVNETAAQATPLLEVRNVSKVFGRLAAVDNVSITVHSGERRALIGPNGAGKSTLFKLINGQLRPNTGSIQFRGADITACPVHDRVRQGMAMTFQHNNLLDDLTVRENVTLAVQRRLGTHSDWMRPIRHHRAVHDRSEEILELMALNADSSRLAGDLAHGQRRSVEIALAYAAEPELLLLDEPAAGMSPGEIEDFLAVLLGLRNITFVMIEHHMDLVLRVATEISVLDAGRVIAEGKPAEVTKSAEVQRAYLGDSLGEDLFL